MSDEKDPQRLREAFIRRNRAARQQLLNTTYRVDESDSAGDDGPVTNFGKGLEHDDDGVPTEEAYRSLVEAINNPSVEEYNDIKLGGDGVPGTNPTDASRRLVEPNGSQAFQDMGADPHAIQIRPHPSFDSDQNGAEMVELYWRALCRDVPYGSYGTSEPVKSAVSELSGFPGYAGPGSSADPSSMDVSGRTVFRGIIPGAQKGPRISQFLWKDIPRGAIPLSQRIRILTGAEAEKQFENGLTLKGPDYLTNFDNWLAVQNGVPVEAVNPPPNLVDKDKDPDEQGKRHIICGRDLANKVRRQVPYLSIRDAAEILLGMGVPKDPHIPYQQAKDFNNSGAKSLSSSATEDTDGIRTGKPFLNFGPHDVLDTVVDVFMTGQNACWYRKWDVHRRLRPEEYGGRVHVHKSGSFGRSFSSIPNNLLESIAVHKTYENHGSYLLPQAYTEGSPTHPSFPAGHSGVAGACVTVLKAMFDGTHEFTNSEMVVPVGDNTTPVTTAYGHSTDVRQTNLSTIDSEHGGTEGTIAATQTEIDNAANSPVTVNDELNKLAANMALGRNWAGIHYRTDGIDGFLVGEQAAVRYLQDHLRNHNLPFDGYRLEQFFDKYPGTLDGAEPNIGNDPNDHTSRGRILIKPNGIEDLNGNMKEVDDPNE